MDPLDRLLLRAGNAGDLEAEALGLVAKAIGEMREQYRLLVKELVERPSIPASVDTAPTERLGSVTDMDAVLSAVTDLRAEVRALAESMRALEQPQEKRGRKAG